MSDLLKQMMEKDPERILRAMAKVLPLLGKTREFMDKLQAEKGKAHVTLAKAMFQLYDTVALLALYQGRHDMLGTGFTDKDRLDTLDAVVHSLQNVCCVLGEDLGVSEADFREISDAAKAQSDAALELATS